MNRTLKDIAIILFILAVFAAIAIPTMQNYSRRTHYNALISAVVPFKKAVSNCFKIADSLSECNSGTLGIPQAILPRDHAKGIYSLNVENGKIKLIPRSQFGIKHSDNYVVSPIIKRGLLLWITSGNAVTLGYAN